MTEESGQKRVVGRTVALALGLVCVLLAAGLVGVLAVYLSGGASSAEIDKLKTENEGLKGNLTSLTNQVFNLQNSLSQANTNLENLRTEYESAIAESNEAYLSLLNLLNLNVSMPILLNQAVQLEAGANTTLFNDFFAEYAGYFTVQVTSSSNTTYAQVLYSYLGFNFDDVVTVGESGTAAFAVLPGIIEVRLGNTEPATAVTATVAVRYVY